MAIICEVCAASNTDGMRFCTTCASPLPDSPVIIKKEDQRDKTPITPDQSKVVPPPWLPEVSVTPPVVPDSVRQPVQSNLVGGTRTPAKTGPKLIVTRGTVINQVFELNPTENEIGRQDEDENFYPHIDLDKQDTLAYIHRRHAYLRCDNGRWWLSHVGAKNPTKLRHNGQITKVEKGQPVEIYDGDEIILGEVFLRFQRD